MKPIGAIVLAGAVIFTAALVEAAPPQFSADIRMLKQGEVTDAGKFYLGREGVRMQLDKARQVSIFRYDKDVVWSLMEADKMYVEMKMQFNALANTKWEGFAETCEAGDTLDGHPTKKCRVEGTFLGKKVASYVWKAQDLGGAVIRSTDEDGKYGQELVNVVKGPQPPSLFQEPRGYKKISAGAGLGDLLKSLAK